MFSYNYMKKTNELYVSLPNKLEFNYDFHEDMNEFIARCDTDEVQIILVSSEKNVEYDNLCKAYFINVLLKIDEYKKVLWNKNLSEMINSTVKSREGRKFSYIDIDAVLSENKSYFYIFKGDKDVYKPVHELAKLITEQNLVLESENVIEFLSTIIGEIFSNCINHSDQDMLYLMYDIVYNDGDFYLVVNVTDYGKTIVYNVNNYQRSIGNKQMTNIECIEWAIQYGNTTRIGSGGYGLPSLIQYIKEANGELYILSGSGNYFVKGKYEKIEQSKGFFKGTSVTFKIKLYDTSRIIKYNENSNKVSAVMSLDDI